MKADRGQEEKERERGVKNVQRIGGVHEAIAQRK